MVVKAADELTDHAVLFGWPHLLSNIQEPASALAGFEPPFGQQQTCAGHVDHDYSHRYGYLLISREQNLLALESLGLGVPVAKTAVYQMHHS